MPSTATARAAHPFVIVNPAAGNAESEATRAALERLACLADGSCVVHRTTRDDSPTALARAAAGQGCDLVVAAGGDGTVSAVADGLVGTPAALGILPLGTANVLAQELGIPTEVGEAAELLAGSYAVRTIDAMRVGDRHYFTQLGVGLDALMIRDTDPEQKQRFGRAAYLWTAAKQVLGFRPHRFSIAIDGGRRLRPRTAQVVVANCGTLGMPPFRWGQGVRVDDGRVDLCIVRGPTIPGFLALAWHSAFGRRRPKDSPTLIYHAASRSIAISADVPLPVQADGEVIGQTPIEVAVVPVALRVAAPEGEGPPSEPRRHEGATKDAQRELGPS